MRKFFVFLFCLLGLFSLGITIHAEEPEVTEPEQVEVQEFASKVIIGECKYGDATVDITEGNVGDIVTIFPSAQVFCRLVAVKVNGEEVAKNANGEYKFALVEGDNVVSIECEVNQEDMQVIVDLIENAKKGTWEDVFSFNNIFNLISWAISLFMGSGFLITLLRNKKIKAMTALDISTKIQQVVPETVQVVVKENFAPIINNIQQLTADINEACNTLVRCMMLMQENNPESRLAVTKELANLNRTTTDLESKVRSIINQEISKIEAAKMEKQQAIATLEERNNNLIAELAKEEENNGRI